MACPRRWKCTTRRELADLLARFAAADCEALVSESLLGQQVTQYSIPFARNGSDADFVRRPQAAAGARALLGRHVRRTRAACRRSSRSHDARWSLSTTTASARSRFCMRDPPAAVASSRSTRVRGCNMRWHRPRGTTSSGCCWDDARLPHARVSEGLRWIDFQSDLFGALSSSEGAVRHGQISLASYLASLARANVYARFDWRDPAPAFHRTSSSRRTVRGRPPERSAQRIAGRLRPS